MKLPRASMDYTMDGLSMEKDATALPSDRVDPSHRGEPNTFLQLTPATTLSQPATGQRSRRNTVAVACERCRKRKTKCSGLPGPCTNCARLNVACHEPGRRKSSVQSSLEDRIQRLRTLTAANRQNVQGQQVHMGQGWLGQLPGMPASNAGLMPSTTGPYDFHVPSPVSQNSSEGWAAAGDPASYFDSRLQDVLDWSMSDYPSENASVASRRSVPPGESDSTFVLPARGSVFSADPRHPSRSTEGFVMPVEEPANLNVPQPESPFQRREPTPIGFTISYDVDELEIKHESEASSPSSIEQEPPVDETRNQIENLQFTRQYSLDARSSMRSSPALSTRALPQRKDSTGDRESVVGQQLTRSQTVPTSYPETDVHHEMDLVSLIIRSPETQKYIEKYFATVHNDFPFLDPAVFEEKRSLADQLPYFNYNLGQRHLMLQFQALMAAAIGVLVQLESTNLSSQYIQQAVSLQDQFDMWSSVGGVHCALLLALYCYLAQVMVYDTRQDESADAQQSRGGAARQSRYPVSNLWLHDCQIAATCIDLGMHQPLAMQEQIQSQADVRGYLEACQNTIRSAYLLDRRISELRNRPRAFHDEDIDRSLVSDL